MISDVEIGNVQYLNDKLWDDLKNNKLGPIELQNHVNAVKDWLKQRDPSPSEIQHMSKNRVEHIADQTKHIVNLVNEVEAILVLREITHFNKALVIIPKLVAIAHFQYQYSAYRNA